MRILLAEHDVHTAHTVAGALEMDGFIVDRLGRGDDAYESVRHFVYDVVLLNTALPGMTGFDVLRHMRRARREMPVVILTSDMDPQVRIEAFKVGADDVVSLPADPAELAARLHAIVRRSRGLDNPVVKFGDLQVNFNSADVSYGGQPVHLTGKEFSILQLLILRRGTVLTKDAFMNHLYGGMDEPEMKIVDVFVCKLRRKLQAVGAADLIVTVWGRGYMLRDTRPKASVIPDTLPAATSRARHLTSA